MNLDLVWLLILPISIGGLSTLFFVTVGERIGLVDYPDHRKHHGEPTVTAGGLSIFVTVLICSIFLIPQGHNILVYFVCSSMLVILGLLDDISDIPAVHRLITQSFIALLMCTQGGLYITELGDLFGLGEVNLGYFGYLLTVVAVIAAINAFNMIDGIDGLLGSTALIIFSALSILFSLTGDVTNLKFSLLIAISIVPYLWVNLQIRPIWLEKMFMGDTGSMLIGFSVVWLLIQGSQGEIRSLSVTTALWLICFPLMDMARVMLSRKWCGQSMMEADRTHLHHLLTDNRWVSGNAHAGMSSQVMKVADFHKKPLFMINTFSLLAAAMGSVLEVNAVPEWASLLLFMVAFGLYVYSVHKVLAKKQHGKSFQPHNPAMLKD